MKIYKFNSVKKILFFAILTAGLSSCSNEFTTRPSEDSITADSY